MLLWKEQKIIKAVVRRGEEVSRRDCVSEFVRLKFEQLRFLLFQARAGVSEKFITKNFIYVRWNIKEA